MEYINSIIVSTALIFISFHIIKYLINKFREYDMVKSFSGPKAYPLIGNINFFLGDVKDISYRIIKFSTIYTSLWRLWIGPKLVIILSDPDYIKILNKSSYGYKKSDLYGFLTYFLGNGLLTAPPSLWKIHREVLNSGFKKHILKTQIDSMVKHANRFARILENSNTKEIDTFRYVSLCTLDIVCDVILGSDLDLQNSPECKLPENITEASDITMQRIIKFWLHSDIIFDHSLMGKKSQEYLSYLNEISSEIIRKKEESVLEDVETNETDTKKNTGTIIDILFKSFNETGEYSEQHIQEEINTMFLAGSETVARALSFAFLMLATYPEIQERVYEELYQIYGSSDPEDVPITYEDTINMRVLERVINETLRLFPSIPLIGRILTEDIKVDENLIIPKNCNVIFMIFNLHRNEKYWKDPLTFNPDRFLPGNYDHKCFLPFSVGKRDCIGQRFAMIEMKVIIATVLRKFVVQIDNPITIEDICLELSITLKSAEPILLKFNKR